MPQLISFKERLCSALLARKLVTKQQLSRLSKETGGSGRRLIQLLIDHGVLTHEKLFGLLAEELNVPVLSLSKYRIDPELAKVIPERMAKQYNLIPVSKLGQRLVVAMSDPTNIVALDDLKALTEYEIDPVLAQEAEIRKAIEQAYAVQSSIEHELTADGESDAQAGGDLDSVVESLLNQEASDVPVVKVINMMISEALLRRASDIHLEPLPKALRVRYRIDGQLKEAHRLPKQVQNTVLTRLKIMSGLDIAEWRLPQDGRFKVHLDTQEVDFRVSILPVIHGGKVVMRVLDKKNLSIGLDQLGFLPESIQAFKEAVTRPYGMILVTGPTGSGKSTTLYSILSELNSPVRHITTIEDPVEYQIEGITQVQVNPEIQLTFASGLRALLRQSPDVVMIGEIRDSETADIALKASLTGQLVLSTLHTNDASSAVTRLVDMGVEPFLVASSVTLIEAQRLVRKLCPKCRKAYQPAPALLERVGIVWQDSRQPAPAAGNGGERRLIVRSEPPFVLYQAAGCHSCNGTGYRGRMGIVEVLTIDERVRDLIVSKAQSWQIKDYAIEHLGLTPLRTDGLKKAVAGVTTLEEVLQITSEE